LKRESSRIFRTSAFTKALKKNHHEVENWQGRGSKKKKRKQSFVPELLRLRGKNYMACFAQKYLNSALLPPYPGALDRGKNAIVF
jgi:hypothetical protein